MVNLSFRRSSPRVGRRRENIKSNAVARFSGMQRSLFLKINPLLNLIFFTKKKEGRRKNKLLTATTSDRVDASDGRTRAVLLLHQPSAGGEVWWVVRGKGEGTKTPRASFSLPVIGRVYSTTCHVITRGGGGFFTHSFYCQYGRCGRDPQVHNDKVGLPLGFV